MMPLSYFIVLEVKPI